jgi:hypothetical protein
MPSIYDQIKDKIEELGGATGPAGVGSVNTTGGTEIKIKYKAPPGFRVHHVIPYLIGESPDPTSTSSPPAQVKRLLGYQYIGPNPPTSPKGWRCFKVDDIDSLLPSPGPRPTNPPELDPDRQNCVTTW